MAKKKKHRKKYFTISVTSDYSVDKTKYYKSRFNLFKVSMVTTILVVIIGIGLTAFEFYELAQMESKLRVFRSIISEQEDIIADLGDAKAELEKQNEILNNSVAQAKAESDKAEEENQARHLPSFFPLTGSALISNVDTKTGTDEETGEEIVTEITTEFAMSGASDVVATADGVVTAVKENSTYGRLVQIDHQNGYVTIYMNDSDPKVNLGDEVVRGAIIFVGGSSNDTLGYQIIYEGEYIDPMQIIAVDG